MSDTAAVPKAPRAQTEIDITGQTVTVEGERYALADLPAAVTQYLALTGLRARLVQVEDRGAAFAALVSGKLPMRQPAAERVSTWHQAIAAAIVEETRKTPSPVLPDAAAEMVRGMTKAQQTQARQQPLVIKHHQRITGTKSSLLDIVQGAAEPAAAEEAA